MVDSINNTVIWLAKDGIHEFNGTENRLLNSVPTVVAETLCEDDKGEFWWPMCCMEGCKNHAHGFVYGGKCSPHLYPQIRHKIKRALRRWING